MINIYDCYQQSDNDHKKNNIGQSDKPLIGFFFRSCFAAPCFVVPLQYSCVLITDNSKESIEESAGNVMYLFVCLFVGVFIHLFIF